MGKEIDVFIEVCRKGAVIPEYARAGDAGMDVCAAEDVVIKPGATVIVPTGLKLAVPEGYEIQVRPRSGLSLNTPLRLSNSPGTIDSGYRGELGIIMANTSMPSEEVLGLDEKGNKPGVYKILQGQRVAQIVLKEVPKIKFVLTCSVDDIGEDRRGGFGSTGV